MNLLLPPIFHQFPFDAGRRQFFRLPLDTRDFFLGIPILFAPDFHGSGEGNSLTPRCGIINVLKKDQTDSPPFREEVAAGVGLGVADAAKERCGIWSIHPPSIPRPRPPTQTTHEKKGGGGGRETDWYSTQRQKKPAPKAHNT